MGLRLLGREGCRAWMEASGTNGGAPNTEVGFVLHAMRELADSPKQVLKQAMLHHEVMFRNQVLELHRLYWTQKNLMNDPCWKDFNNSVVSLDGRAPSRFTEMDFLVVNSPVMNCHGGSIFQEFTVGHTQAGIFNLQLPAEEHSKNADTECLETRNSLHCKVFGDSDPEELELTLGNTKQGNDEREHAEKTLYGKNSCLSAKNVINLEESAAFSSSDSACMPSVHLPTLSSVAFTGRRKKEATHKPSVYHPNADHSERLRDSNSLHLDFAGWCEFSGCFPPHVDTREVKPTSTNPQSFDLNIMQFESFPEISQHVVKPSSANSSTNPYGILNGLHANTVATPTSLGESSNKPSEETLALQTSDKDSASMHSQAKEADFLTHGYGLHRSSRHGSTEKTQIAGCAWNSIQEDDDLVTLRSHSQKITNPRGNSKEGISGSFDGNGIASVDESQSLPPSGLYQLSNQEAGKSLDFPGCCIQSARKNIKTMSIVNDEQLNSKKSEDDATSFSQCGNLMFVEGAISVPFEKLQDEHYGADPLGEKPGHAERNKACSRNKAEVEGHSACLAVTQKYSGKQRVITEADNHVTKSCCFSDSTDESLGRKEKHGAEMDYPILRAAETLIHISLWNTSSTSDKVTNVGKMDMEMEDRSDQPQNSSDSFESMVLMLTETVNDEYSMPSRLTAEETERDKCSFKLRKGRGLRDFQREVLPGLISLSRHEICEDLYTIAEAVRMHELRYGSKKPSEGNWFTHVRSRRSRLSYVHKRQ